VNGALGVGFVALVLAFWLALLNARDRRRDRTASVVSSACAAPALRGLIALRVRAPLLSSRTVAVLDMSACAAADVWPTMRRLAHILPLDVGLVIETCLDGGPDVSSPGRQSATHRHHRWLGLVPSSEYAIFIRVR
jgi:hypothetical protein